MTKKDYIVLAKTLKALQPGDGTLFSDSSHYSCREQFSGAVLTWRKTVKAIADTCAEQHAGNGNQFQP